MVCMPKRLIFVGVTN